jgi:hypothetical protein
MAAGSYIYVEAFLLETIGPLYMPGRLRLFCWFKAAHLPGTQIDGARVSVVACSDQAGGVWKEYSQDLVMEQSMAIIESLERLGIPGRALDAQGNFDTGDSWSNILFQVQREDETFTQSISMQCSGFDGNDAEELKSLFRQLFDLAGYDGYSQVIYNRA